MLFNEPKLLKSCWPERSRDNITCFSALQRAEIAEIRNLAPIPTLARRVSVLFNEPKLLKSDAIVVLTDNETCFSALQRAEIAEIALAHALAGWSWGFSALQRAEIAEICIVNLVMTKPRMFQCSSTSRNC